MDERINRIRNRYNPDNDIRLDGPPVTWDVMLLANTLDETIARLGMVTRAMVGFEEVVRELRSNVQQMSLDVESLINYMNEGIAVPDGDDFDEVPF